MQTNLLQLSKTKNYFRTIKNASHNKILVKYNIYKNMYSNKRRISLYSDLSEEEALKATNLIENKRAKGPIASKLSSSLRKSSEKSTESKTSFITNYTYDYNRDYILDGLSDISSFELDNDECSEEEGNSFRSSIDNEDTENILIYHTGEEKERIFD